jgi:hypothetical protein
VLRDDVASCELADDCVWELDMIARFEICLLFLRKEDAEGTGPSDEDVPSAPEIDSNGPLCFYARSDIPIVELVLR